MPASPRPPPLNERLVLHENSVRKPIRGDPESAAPVWKVSGLCGQCLWCRGLGEPWKLLHVQVGRGDLLRPSGYGLNARPPCPPASVLAGHCFSGLSSLWKLFLHVSLSLALCRSFTGKKLFIHLVSTWV